MGMMGLARGAAAVGALCRAAQGLSEVFLPNATEGALLDHEARRAALDQLGAEFAQAPRGGFDRVVDGLNRLPRPMLAFGTLGLFAYAMAEPEGFAARMVGLGHVPDPLWWLLGAIVGFYFGARELHYRREPAPRVEAPRPEPVRSAWIAPAEPEPRTPDPEDGEPNAALDEWRATRAG
jgi:hypothetical protein